MSEFKAEFYENGDEIPVKEFLDSLDDKMRCFPPLPAPDR